MATSLTFERELGTHRSLHAVFAATFDQPCPAPVLSSELVPDITCEVDDADAHARLHVDVCPPWPAPKRVSPGRFRGPYFGGARHQWALYSEGTATLDALLIIQCRCCGTQFSVTKCTGGWVCMCQTCTMDAASADDGGMPPCGEGETALEAADYWRESL